MEKYNVFEDFLTNVKTYQALREHWQQIFGHLAAEHGQSYHPYLNDDNCCDGNPIFNAFLPDLARAVRIVQEDPNEAVSQVDISAWIDKAIIMAQAEREVPELVISLVLNEWTAPIASHLLSAWLSPQAPSDAIIDELIQLGTPPFLKSL